MTIRPEIIAPQATPADNIRMARWPQAISMPNPFHCQPPAYSPVPRASILAAAREATSAAANPCAALSDLLRRDYSVDHAVLCASGTMALQLAIGAAIDAIGAETPVALPAFSCYDVATAAVGAGARIAMYDVDPETLGPDLDSLEAVLRSGARVVVVAHLFGVPVDWDAVGRMTAAHGALIIEDAAQGHGARWNGRPLGGLGTIGVLSFGRGKGWTGGAGGAVLIRSTPAPIDVKALRLPAVARATGDTATQLRVWAQWAFARPALYGLPALIPWLGLGETRYRSPVAPRTIGRFSAALLVQGRVAAEREAETRRRTGRALAASLVECRNLDPITTACAGASPGFLRFPVRMRRGFHALPTRNRLARLGVAPSYPKPLARLPEISGHIVSPDRRFAGAETLARDLVTIPTHSLLTGRERQQVLRLLDTRVTGAS